MAISIRFSRRADGTAAMDLRGNQGDLGTPLWKTAVGVMAEAQVLNLRGPGTALKVTRKSLSITAPGNQTITRDINLRSN